jgi:5-bromo-4-chloroindolyl phosphate hydrolysis protein
MGLRWKLILAFAAIFLIGGLCGSALTLVVAQIKIPGLASEHNRHRWENEIVRNLTNKLGLSTDQQKQFRPQIAAALQQMRTLRRQLVLQSDDLLDQAFQRLESDLTLEQQQKMETFREKRKARIQRQLEAANQGNK